MGEAEKAAETRARLLAFHSNNNSMGLFYDLYQHERPRTALREIALGIASEKPKTGQPAKARERGD